MSTQEEWRPIERAPGYEVSNMGRVRSLDRTIKTKAGRRSAHSRTYKGCLMRLGLHRYFLANLAGKTCLVHQLVAEAFIGPCPPGHVVCHGPGGPLDNRLENISYGTLSKNAGEDKRRDGTMLYGERSPNAKLTKAQVAEIKCRASNGEKGTLLSREFEVSEATISRLINGHRWGWLEVA